MLQIITKSDNNNNKDCKNLVSLQYKLVILKKCKDHPEQVGVWPFISLTRCGPLLCVSFHSVALFKAP